MKIFCRDCKHYRFYYDGVYIYECGYWHDICMKAGSQWDDYLGTHWKPGRPPIVNKHNDCKSYGLKKKWWKVWVRKQR